MEATTLDVLVKPADFERRTAGLRLARWKWDVLALVDGARSIGAIASIAHVDLDLLFAFVDECVAAELIAIEALTFEQYSGASVLAAAPQPIALNAAPEPAIAVTAPAEPAVTHEPETYDVPGVAIEMEPIGADVTAPVLAAEPALAAPEPAVAPEPVVVAPAIAVVDDDADAVSIEIAPSPAPAPPPSSEVYSTEIAFEPEPPANEPVAVEIDAEPQVVAVPEPEPIVAAAPEPVVAAAPAIEPPPPAPSNEQLPRTASLQERVAALKARALSAMQDASPKPDALEFSLSTPSKPAETPASADAIEFSL